MADSSFRLFGRSILAMALSPQEPLTGWFDELDTLAARSPGFFGGRPLILDASKLARDDGELRELVDKLRSRGISIMAIEGSDCTVAKDMPPIIAATRRPSGPPARDDSGSAGAKPADSIGFLTIDQPVRSGQSIQHDGDITIIGSVASGAEIVAGGSIHIYGALRGRAFAGSGGNNHARIFCTNFDAELIAVDGLYQTAEDVPARLRSQAIQAWLEGDAIRVAELH
jgi:septum site-determining protein MinC